MVISESILAIIITAIFGAYSIKLNNYLTDKFPNNMNEFQILRNSTWADGLLIGLGITTVLSLFYSNAVVIFSFIVFNTLYSIWMIYNWNFFDKREL